MHFIKITHQKMNLTQHTTPFAKPLSKQSLANSLVFSSYPPPPRTDYQVVTMFLLYKTLFIKCLFVCFCRHLFVCLGKDFYLFPLNEKLYSAKINLYQGGNLFASVRKFIYIRKEIYLLPQGKEV